MKKLENKKFKISEKQVSYGELSLAVVNNLPKGADIAEMKKRIRLSDIFEKDVPSYDIEDADFEFFKELVKAMTWAICSKDIVAFCDCIEKL